MKRLQNLQHLSHIWDIATNVFVHTFDKVKYQKVIMTIAFVLLTSTAYGQAFSQKLGEGKLYGILRSSYTQVETTEFVFANVTSTTGYYELSRAEKLHIFHNDNLYGSYTSKHGDYVSFSYAYKVLTANNGLDWAETTQFVFHPKWSQLDENQYCAFVVNKSNDELYLVDVETDMIIDTYTFQQSAKGQFSVRVSSNHTTKPYLDLVIINCMGTVSIYNSINENQSEKEYVDLGLSSGTLWATSNVGASSPEDYGDYYAFGETATKSIYIWDNYKYSDGDSITKYNNTSSNGKVDNLLKLENKDDAAYVNCGISWLTPTQENFSELINECECTYEEQNGVNGLTCVGPNGNSIFLPAAGFSSSGTYYNEEAGYYMTKSVYQNNTKSVWLLKFNDGETYSTWTNYRCYGYTIRPILKSTSNVMLNHYDTQGAKAIYDTKGRKLEEPIRALTLSNQKMGPFQK